MYPFLSFCRDSTQNVWSDSSLEASGAPTPLNWIEVAQHWADRWVFSVTRFDNREFVHQFVSSLLPLLLGRRYYGLDR